MSFQYSSSSGQHFECNLTCARCEAKTVLGLRCGRTTCKVLPYCIQHMKSLLGVQIKPSTIPNAGLGLFALRDFAYNEQVCEYAGEKLSKAEVDARYGKGRKDFAPYGAKVTRNVIIDPACERSVGAFINSKPGHQNARFVVDTRSQRIRVVATRHVRAGEEFFVSYGPSSRLYTGQTRGPKASHKTVPYKKRGLFSLFRG